MLQAMPGFKTLIYEVQFNVEEASPTGASAAPAPAGRSLFPSAWLKFPSIPDQPGRKDNAPEHAIVIPLEITGKARTFELLTSTTNDAPGFVIDPGVKDDRDFFRGFSVVVGSPWIARVSEPGVSTLKMIAYWPCPTVEKSFITRMLHVAQGGC